LQLREGGSSGARNLVGLDVRTESRWRDDAGIDDEGLVATGANDLHQEVKFCTFCIKRSQDGDNSQSRLSRR
jgi:hypothetical protein